LLNAMTFLQFYILLLFSLNFSNAEQWKCATILREKGNLQSTNYPSKYPNNYDCSWTIEARPHDIVKIKFTDFQVEPGERCEFDYMIVKWKSGQERLCGDSIKKIGRKRELTTRGRTLLRMVSDDSVNLKGFSLNFVVEQTDPPDTTIPTYETTTIVPTQSFTPLIVSTTTPTIQSHQEASNEPHSCGSNNPCQHDSECVDVDEGHVFCFCDDGYEGDFCETDTDECESNPCHNNATCIDGANKWSCECQPGFVGEDCAINIDECRINQCKNGATCIDGVNTFTCICVDGYTDWDCSTNIDECSSNPCQNMGVCEDHEGYFTCICHPDFSGNLCEINLKPTTTTATTTATTSTTTTTAIQRTRTQSLTTSVLDKTIFSTTKTHTTSTTSKPTTKTTTTVVNKISMSKLSTTPYTVPSLPYLTTAATSTSTSTTKTPSFIISTKTKSVRNNETVTDFKSTILYSVNATLGITTTVTNWNKTITRTTSSFVSTIPKTNHSTSIFLTKPTVSKNRTNENNDNEFTATSVYNKTNNINETTNFMNEHYITTIAGSCGILGFLASSGILIMMKKKGFFNNLFVKSGKVTPSGSMQDLIP